MQPLERPTIESYGAIILTIITAVVPMTTWLRVVLVFLAVGLIIDIICRSRWAISIRPLFKALMSCGLVVLVAAICLLAWQLTQLRPSGKTPVEPHTDKPATAIAKDGEGNPAERPKNPIPQPIKARSFTKEAKIAKNGGAKSTHPPTEPVGGGTVGTVNTGPCSVVQVGGIGNQGIAGNCGPPEPNLRWERVSSSAKGTTIMVRVDRTWDMAGFVADCNHPCSTQSVGFEGSFGGWRYQKVTVSGADNKIGLILGQSLGGGLGILWIIEPTKDGEQVEVTSVSKMPEKEIRTLTIF